MFNMESTATATKTYAPWFTDLMSTFNTKAESLQLDEEAASEMRQLFIDKCREQYAAGNRSGAGWMRQQIQKERQHQHANT